LIVASLLPVSAEAIPISDSEKHMSKKIEIVFFISMSSFIDACT